jgi:hypothetical protein
MDVGAIYIKTTAGGDELRSRARTLPQRLRTMLIMVDGTRSVSQLQQAAARLGAPDDFLASLESQGLVERVGPTKPAVAPRTPVAAPLAVAVTDGERFNAAKKFMNDTMVDAVGLRAFFFTLKLEKCFTLADLQSLLPDYAKAIAKASGEEVARALETQARDKLR